jgi:hypothetical protein
MSGACGTHGGEAMCKQDFDRGNLREKYHLEDLGVDGRIPYGYEKCFPQRAGIFLLVEKNAASFSRKTLFQEFFS